MTTTVLILLLAFQLKHFLAYYPLQFSYMYMNKGAKTGWVTPLSHHAAVHTLLTLLILGSYAVYTGQENELDLTIAYLALFDFVTHFVIDRVKATRTSKPDESQFWINLGLDQFAHHIVGIIIVYFILNYNI